jgi:signal transduction histidine kinase
MKISAKLLLPIVFLLTILICVFSYLLLYIKQSEKLILKNNDTTRKVNDFSTRINLTRQATDIYTLSYRFNKDPKYLDLVKQNQQTVSELLTDVKPLVTTTKGIQLLENFERSRSAVQKIRKDLFEAIKNEDEIQIHRDFYIWQIVSENSYSELLNFANYNLQSVERNELFYRDLISRIYIIAIFLILLTFTLISLLYFYLRRIITYPIQLISKKAEEISLGDFEHKISINSNDELGNLAKSLNIMSGKLKKYYQSLQNEVNKKDLELQRNKAFEAQKDDFMSIASHELKTPVTSLKVFIQLMQQQTIRNGHTEYQRYLLKADDQINRLISLISNLLDVTKIQSGKMPLALKVFDLNKCIEDIVEVSLQTSKKHKIIVRGKVLHKIFGDEDKICQVLNNLITNAIKYSPKSDQIVLDIKNNKDTVTVSVQDFGIGIDEKHQSKIFDRFYRVSESNGKTFPGLGIGLYISSDIIKRHNGSLQVTSKKDKGSIFSFTLPYKGLDR